MRIERLSELPHWCVFVFISGAVIKLGVVTMPSSLPAGVTRLLATQAFELPECSVSSFGECWPDAEKQCVSDERMVSGPIAADFRATCMIRDVMCNCKDLCPKVDNLFPLKDIAFQILSGNGKCMSAGELLMVRVSLLSGRKRD